MKADSRLALQEESDVCLAVLHFSHSVGACVSAVGDTGVLQVSMSTGQFVPNMKQSHRHSAKVAQGYNMASLSTHHHQELGD